MNTSIAISDMAGHGVRLISPPALEFDDLARPLIGTRASRVLKMKPMLVVVANDSPSTIVALSVIWRVTKPVGGLVHETNSTFPHVVCGDQLISRSRPGVRPGERHVVAAGCVVEGLDDIGESDEWIEHFVAERDRAVQGARTIAIELDAVIFEDGRLIGPDGDAWLSQLIGDYVTAKQSWYRTILSRLDAGVSVEDAYAPIRDFQEENLRVMGSPEGRLRAFDTRHVWRTQAAAEAASWRRRYSDDEVALHLKAVRLEPFVIRRK